MINFFTEIHSSSSSYLTTGGDKSTVVKSLKTKLQQAETLLLENTRTLECFKAILGLDMVHFAEQWRRQRELQIEMIDDPNHEEVQRLLEQLGDLQEDLEISKLVRFPKML